MKPMTAAADEHLQMIEDCEERESRLSEWEAGFIDSVKTHLQRGRALSGAQAVTLDAIWERATANG